MRQRQFAQKSPDPVHLMLTVLAEQPMHALALREKLEVAKNAHVEPGSFHRVIVRLEQHGLIESKQNWGRLRLYRITVSGLLTLERISVQRQKQRSRDMWSPGFRRRKERMMQLVTWMLQLYPRAWRERYATEMTALLEQHSITLWTILDLLFGALDARLDPYYHRERLLIPRLPWRGLQSSWNLMITAFVTFWLTQILWVSGGATWGPLSFSWPVTDITLLPGILAYLSLPVILTALVGWIGWQGGKNAWHLLRLLPVFLFIQLLLFSPWLDGWQNALLWIVLLLALALTASNIGSMLTAFKHWEKRVNLPLALCTRLLALLLIAGMTLLCFINGTWMHMFWISSWNLALSPYWWYGPVTLTLELATMILSTLLACIALVRSLLELKTLHKNSKLTQATPQQDLLARALSDQPPPEGDPVLSSVQAPATQHNQPFTPQKAQTQRITWLIISLILLSIFIISFVVIANFTYAFDAPISNFLVIILLLSGSLASVFIAFIVGKGNSKDASFSKQQPLFQQMQVARERN
ncbi:MAG TPA: helix-turn-helix transcriptional regulator [Ktedonobacteraceae bacterium]